MWGDNQSVVWHKNDQNEEHCKREETVIVQVPTKQDVSNADCEEINELTNVIKNTVQRNVVKTRRKK